MKNYIVFDLEWNQSPQGKDNSIEELPFEIIEIGAVKLDENLQSISEFHRLISPKVYQQMHYKISEVTHMNMAQLRLEGEDFCDAVEEFITWCGTDFLFCTWGSMDLTELQRNMSYYGVRNPFAWPLFYYDIQKLYALLQGETKMKSSLDTAVEEMEVEESRPFHRALDDAFYTGKIMQNMNFEAVEAYYSTDYYHLPQNREEEIYLKFPTYSKYVSRIFLSKEDALADKIVTDMLCCHCGRMLKKTVRWFSFNQKAYFCLASCPEHGFVRGKIRMKKADGGRVYVVKTMKLIDEDSAREVYDRKDDLKKRRTEKNKLKKIDRKSVSQNS